MNVSRLEFLVEEPSMEAFLRSLLPRLLPDHVSFEVHPYQGKADLLAKLPDRLNAYARWLPEDWRIIVLVDRDDEDCHQLKRQLEATALNAGLLSRSNGRGGDWQVATRIVIEELEAWYFGDWVAVLAVFPRVSPAIPNRQGYRDPDSIRGGTWEAFERVLNRHDYARSGLRKIETARSLGAVMEPERNRSASFGVLYRAILEALE